jgi:hypothetical protein
MAQALNPSGILYVPPGLTFIKFYILPTECSCVLYGSQNKQPLVPYTALADCFLEPRRNAFTVR